MTVKGEIEKTWSKMTKARRKGEFKKLGMHVETMMDILSGVLEEDEMKSLEREMGELDEKHREAYARVKDDTMDYSSPDRNTVRTGRFFEQDVWLMREKYKVVTGLIIDKDLVNLE